MAPFFVSVTSTATIVLGDNSDVDPLQLGGVASTDSRSGGSGEYRVSVNNVN